MTFFYLILTFCNDYSILQNTVNPIQEEKHYFVVSCKIYHFSNVFWYSVQSALIGWVALLIHLNHFDCFIQVDKNTMATSFVTLHWYIILKHAQVYQSWAVHCPLHRKLWSFYMMITICYVNEFVFFPMTVVIFWY